MTTDRCPTCYTELPVHRSTYWFWRVRCYECGNMAHYTLDGWEHGWGVAPWLLVGWFLLLLVLAGMAETGGLFG